MSEILWEKTLPSGVCLRVVKGDLTLEATDAIVNAANSWLEHGGGVAGAIVRRGGEVIQEESRRVAPVEVGHAAMTSAGSLAARAVIHTVGPRMGEGDEDRKLASAVTSALRVASDAGFASIAMPAISSGIFGYPKNRCAEVLLAATLDFLTSNPATSLKEIRFCNFDDLTCGIFVECFEKRMEPRMHSD